MRYLIRPLQLKGIDKLAYEAIYENIYDYDNMIAKYTYRQIAEDIRLEFKIEYSPKQIMKSINSMVDHGFISILEKGKKGTPTTFKIIKIDELIGKQIGNEYGTDKEQISVEISMKNNTKETDKKQKGNTIGTPYNIKNNKDKYIVAFTKIFELWNSKKIIVHTKITDKMVKAYEKALKEYDNNEIVEAIENYSSVINSDFYYSYKFSIEAFLKQGNGMSRFVNNGDVYINYLENKKAPTGIGGNKNKANSSICNTYINNTPKVEGTKFI